MTAELQTIKFTQWRGMATQVGEIIAFFQRYHIVSVNYENNTLTLVTSHIQRRTTFELKENCYLVYSNNTGYQVVSEQIFRTFVKTE